MPPFRVSVGPRSWRRWTLSLHRHAGLFASPFVLLYAVSAVLLNHAIMPWGGRSVASDPSRSVRVVVLDTGNSLSVAARIRRQLGLKGEIGFVNRKPGSQRITFPIEIPGRTTTVRVDLTTGVATLEQKETGVWDALIYQHRMPGPHNATIRGNWVFTRLWGWLADASVYAILFLTASGVFLWTAIRSERRMGLVALGTGVLTFTAILFALVA